MIPNLVGMFPVGDLAKGFQKGLRVIIITVLAFNILAVLLLWMGVFKPHKTSHVAGQTTPAPEPVLNLMPVRHYDADGLQFSYYADWTIEKGVPIDGATTLRSIRIEGPGHELVCLACLPAASSLSLDGYAAAVADDRAKAINNETGTGSSHAADAARGVSEAISEKVAGYDYKGIHQHFSINDQGLPVSQDSVFFSIQGTNYKVLIMTRVAENHLQASKSAIDLILDSLRIEGAVQ